MSRSTSAATQTTADQAICGAVDGVLLRSADETFTKQNPADLRDESGPFALASEQVVDGALMSAVAAAAHWKRTPSPARANALRTSAQLLRKRTEEIAGALTREVGKVHSEAVAELNAAADTLDYFAASDGWYDEGRVSSSRRGGDRLLFTRRMPLGVIAVITPWNFPLSNPCLKIAAAVAAGNAVVWKPSSWAPATSLALWQVFTDGGMPDGLINLVFGDAAVGSQLVDSGHTAAVTFTGSTAVGRRVGVAAAARGIPAQLELGGKNASIVLADADLPRAVADVVSGAFLFAGQKCTATSRVIVERTIAADFRRELVRQTEAMTVGDPTDVASALGPVVHPRQREHHLEHLQAAVERGGSILTGGTAHAGPSGSGLYLSPTVVAVADPRDPIVVEEVFGPILALLEVDSLDEAIALVNDSAYGLSAAVHTSNMSSALRAVDLIDSGLVKVNEPTPGLELHMPVGGWKDSGVGSPELGPTAMDFFTKSKTVFLNFS